MTDPESQPADPPMTFTYVTVVVIEILVLMALWILGSYFGS